MGDKATASPPGRRSGWTEIPPTEVPAWDGRLLETNASVFQYPYWNEPFRRMRFSPRYLLYREEDRTLGYVCVQTIGIPVLQLGFIHQGPVWFDDPTGEADLAALGALRRWARRRGFVFLRITHSDPGRLERALATGRADRGDAFPFYRAPKDELTVALQQDERQTLSGFQPVARRKIRRASEAGFAIEATDDPQRLVEVWPLFAALAERKHFTFRPLTSYVELLRLGRGADAARLYIARLDRMPVGAILVIRDRDTAYYISGALDTAALERKPGTPSPACLLHWHAMQDACRAGVRLYHLGSRSGSVYRFKRQFRPEERESPPPVNLVLNPPAYAVWLQCVGWLSALWPRVSRFLFA